MTVSPLIALVWGGVKECAKKEFCDPPAQIAAPPAMQTAVTSLCYDETMKRKQTPKKVSLSSILSGFALPAEMAQRHKFRVYRGSDVDRLRGDVARVGQLFTGVIYRERQKASRST